MSKLRSLLMLVLVACSKTTTPAPELAPEPAPTATQPDAEVAQEEEEEAEEAPPEKFTAMGDWVMGELMSLRVVQATLLPQLEAGTSVATPPAEHRFVRVQIEIENRGVTPHRVRAKRFSLRDQAGRENPVSETHQASFATSSDELLLVPGMREPFELIFTLHNRTEAQFLSFSDAMTRLVSEIKASPPEAPGKKRAARGKAKSAR